MTTILILFIIIILINLLCIQKNKKYNNKYDEENILYVNNSNIHGVGLFTKKCFFKNDFILNIIKNNEILNISKFGRKVNHSYNPNCYLYKYNNDYNIYALRDIYPHEEITADYSKNPWFLKKPEKHYI